MGLPMCHGHEAVAVPRDSRALTGEVQAAFAGLPLVPSPACSPQHDPHKQRLLTLAVPAFESMGTGLSRG